MDCFGLQALSDSSESEVDESLLRVCQNDDNMSIDGSVVEAGNIQNEPSREEKVTFFKKACFIHFKIFQIIKTERATV